MSALVSEEDVLARLLLEWLWDWDARQDKEWAVPDEYLLPKEEAPQALVSALVMELECDLPLWRAIAESERRLELEQAEREVLREVDYWGGRGWPPPPLHDALEQLVRVRAGASRGGV